MIRLEARKEPQAAMRYAAPALAVAATVLAGIPIFAFLGKDPLEASAIFFLSPLADLFSISELLVKSTPLVLIATGLALGFRAGVWNIGAEGQFTVGALAGGCVALAFHEVEGLWLLPAMCLAGAGGGMAWAAVPAFLKTRFRCNEILVSLMLTYVAVLLLGVLVHGPLRSPEGLNFPESRLFHDSATLPLLMDGQRATVGTLLALLAAVGAWLLLSRHIVGFRIRITGDAPRAARFAGFVESRTVWLTLMISGGLAGLAGLLEAAGPVGQLVPSLPVGYGFTAIIVAFLGRLHPLGILPAGLVMAVTYIGGEAIQIDMNLPSAVTGVFQGLLLFFLLGIDVLVRYRVRLLAPLSRPSGA